MSQSYTAEFKKQVIQEAQETQNATIVARRYQLNPSMVRRWMQEGRRKARETQGVDGLVEENTPLKRLVIERDLQIAVLQDVLRKKGLQV
jgi:transposase-like protein